MLRPMSSHEGIGNYTPTASPQALCIMLRCLELLRLARLESLLSSTSRNVAQAVVIVFWPVWMTVDHHWYEQAGCLKNAWCSWEKKFLSWWSVPTLFSEKKSNGDLYKWDLNHYKHRGRESEHIHRKVKCAYFVPEPSSRWHRHMVLGSKEKESSTWLRNSIVIWAIRDAPVGASHRCIPRVCWKMKYEPCCKV